MTIPVSCVEQGRWGYRGRQFRPGDASLYASLRARKAAHVSQPVRAGRGRRGGLYEFSTGEHGLTFRPGDRGAITVKETTLTWTPAGGGSPQTAKLVPLSDQ